LPQISVGHVFMCYSGKSETVMRRAVEVRKDTLSVQFYCCASNQKAFILTAPQTGRIFISYRREDSAGYAGRIYDRLTAHFGKDAIFMDVDTIAAGVDFVEVLENAVQSCDVLVVR